MAENATPSSNGWPECLALQAQVMACIEEGVAVLDRGQQIRGWNRAMELSTGLAAGEVLGRVFFALAGGSGEPRLRAAIAGALEGNPARLDEVSLQYSPGGKLAWFSASLHPLRLPDGAVAGAILTVRDLPKVPALQAAAGSGMTAAPPLPPGEPLRILQALLDAVQESIMMLDALGRVVAVNQTLASRVQRTKAEMIGKNIAEFVPPEVARVRFFWGDKVLKTGQPAVFEDQVCERFVEHHFYPVPDAEGQMRWVATFSRDITARKRAEWERIQLLSQIRQTEEHLRSVLQTTDESVLLLDLEGQVLLANDTAARRLRRSLSEVVGKNVFELLPPEVARVRRGTAQQIIQDGQIHTLNDERDGIAFESLMCPARDAEGRIIGISIFARDVTQRNRAQRAAEQGERKYQTIIETTGTGYVILDSEGRVQDANQEYVRLTGHRGLAEIQGRQVLEWTAAYDRPRNAGEVARCLETGQVRNLEVDYQGPTGVVIPIEINATVVPTPAGQTVVALCRDISERRQTLAALRQSEERFSKAFRLSPVGIIISRLSDGMLVNANEAFLEIMEWDADTVRGRTSIELGFYVDPNQRKELVSIARRGEPICGKDIQVRTRSGRIRNLLFSAEVIDLGGIPHLLSLCLDITQRLQIEEALRQSEERYRILAEAAHDNIFIVGRDGVLQYANRHLAQRAGKANEDLAGTSLKQALPAEQYAELQATFAPVFARNEPVYAERQVTFAGGDVWLGIWMTPLRQEEGKVIAALGQARDITARKVAERQIRRRLEFERLMAGISSRFISLVPLDHAIKESLAEMGRFSQVDRVYVILMNEDYSLARNTHEWCAPGIASQQRLLQSFNAAPFAYWLKLLHEQKEVLVNDRAALPDEAAAERQMMAELQLGAILLMPLWIRGVLAGLVGYDHIAGPRQWQDEEVILLRMFSQVLANAMERDRVEAALRESEERFSKAFHLSPVGATITRLEDGLLVDANEAWLRAMELAPEDIKQRTTRELGLYKDPQQREAIAAAVKRGEPVRGFDIQVSTRRGRLLYMLFSAEVIDLGGVPHLLSLGLDVTHRRQMEEELGEVVEFNRQILLGAQEGLLAADRELRVILWNPFMEQITGIGQSRARGAHLFDLPPALQSLELRNNLARALAGELVASFDQTYALEEGGLGWVAIKAGPLRSASGDITGVLCTVNEITQRKRVEEALRESENLYRFLVANQRDTVTRHQPDGRILYVSPSVQELLGFQPAEAVGLNGYGFIHPEEQEQVREIIARAMTRRRTHFQAVNRMRVKSGGYVWVEIMGRLIFDLQTHEPVEVHCSIRDVRERKQAERALQRSREQMRALAARIEAVREDERSQIAREVHDDLGQTLTGLKLDLAWMAHRFRPNQQPLQEKAAEMSQLIDGTIQTVRRISSDLRPGILDDLGLAAAIEWQAQEFERRTGLPCHYRSEGDIGEWETRRATALFRILQEALTNVVRHAQATEVDVFLARRKNLVVLEVHDNGRGITKEELARPGSLGLLSMRERAFAFGGEVTVEGEPGAGTVVTARMPVRAATHPAEASRKRRKKS